MDEAVKKQLAGLWLDGKKTIRTTTDAGRFLRSVGFALRYNATSGLPLAAMYAAAGDQRNAIQLTNQLLARAEAIETSVIAGRLVLVHKTLMPAIYALRTRDRSRLSANAERALAFIREEGEATAGNLRRHFNVGTGRRPDPADLALTELQREILIDRGPSSIPKKGLPYLSPEGFPYHLFDPAHPDIVAAAGKLTVDQAILEVLAAYLRAAYFVTSRKLASMFKLLLNEKEMRSAIRELIDQKKIEDTQKQIMWIGLGSAAFRRH